MERYQQLTENGNVNAMGIDSSIWNRETKVDFNGTKMSISGSHYVIKAEVSNGGLLISKIVSTESIVNQVTLKKITFSSRARAIDLLHNFISLYRKAMLILWSWISAWSYWLMIFLASWNFNFFHVFFLFAHVWDYVVLRLRLLVHHETENENFRKIKTFLSLISIGNGREAFEACNWPLFYRLVFTLFWN